MRTEDVEKLVVEEQEEKHVFHMRLSPACLGKTLMEQPRRALLIPEQATSRHTTIHLTFNDCQSHNMATLFCTRSTCLRTLPASRALVAAPFPAAFFGTSARPAKQPRLEQSPRPRIASEVRQIRLAPAARNASTTTSTTQAIPDHVLTWDRFFDLRRKRRWLNLGCSVLTSVVTVGAATPLIAQADFDSWGAQISGLDPIVVLGISTFTVAAGGWLCGPSFGNLMFSLWAGRRGWRAGIAEVGSRDDNR